MEKILLIIPPAPYLISDRVFPPLGPLYVSAHLKKLGKKVSILDLTGEKNWALVFKKSIKNKSIKYIGFTATTPDMPIVFAMLKLTKKIRPDIKTVIGGPHATIASETCGDFDCIVIGDGLKSAKTAFSQNASKIIKEPLLKNLDKLPTPDRDAININRYAYYLDGKKAVNIMSHLGCPFNCVFCCGRKTDYYKKVRYRSVSNLLKEMDFLNKKHGYEAFVFYDDEFNLDKNYVLKLCARLIKRNYIWRAPVRADLLTLNLALKMREAGCVEVTVGVESGSAKVLKFCGKKTTPEINAHARKICKKAGIRFKAFVVVGLPGSSKQDEKLTEKWLIKNRPDSIDINVNTPYPSTIEYDEKEKYGLKFNFNFLKDPVSYKYDPKKYKSYCSNSLMTSREILETRKKMDIKVRRALKLPSPK